MKHNFFYIVVLILSLFLFSCSGKKPSSQTVAGVDSQQVNPSSETKADTSSQLMNANSADDQTTNSSQQMLDTNKMKSDLNDVISSMGSKPDTTKLKNAVSDILSTDADMLSDSDINKLYGNSNDPSVTAAKNAMLKMRNSMGLTPERLDSMKKAAAQLRDNGISHH